MDATKRLAMLESLVEDIQATLRLDGEIVHGYVDCTDENPCNPHLECIRCQIIVALDTEDASYAKEDRSNCCGPLNQEYFKTTHPNTCKQCLIRQRDHCPIWME